MGRETAAKHRRNRVVEKYRHFPLMSSSAGITIKTSVPAGIIGPYINADHTAA
jgi:hypothetical protein